MITDEEIGKRWDTWLAEHMKTCATCRSAFTDVDGPGMCEEAFEMVKACARESRDNKRED